MKPKTIFRQEKDLKYQFRRSQLVIAVLSVLLVLAMLNNAYNVVDLSATNVHSLVVVVSALVLLEAIFSVATLIISYKQK